MADIRIKLDRTFTETYNSLQTEYGEQFAKLNGFSDNQLDYTDFISNFIGNKVVADASIDGNSNVSHKDIVSLENEMSKPHSKLIAANKIFTTIKKHFGLQAAKKWFREEWLGAFYMHDFYNATFKPYCYAYDLDKLVNEGLYFISNFNHSAPKHLTTYTDFVGEFVSWNCNRTSGAVGLPSFLVYSYYFWKKDCETGYYIKSPEYYRKQNFQEIIYKLNQPFLRGGIQSAFTNFSIFDRYYYEALFGGKKFPDGSYMIDCIEEFIDYQMSFMETVSEIRSQNMMTFPVLTYSLLRQNGKFEDEDFAKWCCLHNMKWNDSNFFMGTSVTSLSNCCRLQSNIEDLGYFNSVGGTALEVGSVKCNTINLARISYEAKTVEEYLEILKDRTNTCLIALDAVRYIIKRNAEKGLLPNYTHETIKLESQYNTIGIIGLYEALQKFGLTTKDEFGYTYYTDEALAFAAKVFDAINEVKAEFIKNNNCDYFVNIEQIPGERAASVLMQKDKLLFQDEEYELPLYGNQWIPLGIKTTMNEKIRISAKLDVLCNGGSISHINLEAPITDFDTAWNLLNYVADQGVIYCAFCTRISACEHNHGFMGNICPTCGGDVVTTYQRIVGFLTPTNTYSKERKEEFKLRDWFGENAYQGIH